MKNTFYTLLIVLLAVVNLQAQNNHVVKVPTPDEKEVVGAIGGTVDVSALGGATYTIPIQVPEGLGGVQPNLSITYNSQSGNGLLGWGWNLGGMSAITRVGHTIYHDDGYVAGVDFEDDAFALDGQRLFAINGNSYGANGTEYKTETDGMGKIVSYTETLPGHGGLFGHGGYEMLSYFKVYTPEGLTLYYGKDKSDDDNARIIWEHDGKKVVVLWLLKRVEDQNGNYMVYNYDVGRNHGINQHVYHLKNIQYCGNPAAQNVPDNERGTKYGIDFNYKIRNDVERNFVGNYELHYQDLLDNISIYYWNEPLYEYNFQYGTMGLDNNHYSFNTYNNENLGYFYNRLINIGFNCRGKRYKTTIIKWGQNDYESLNFKKIQIDDLNETNCYNYLGYTVKFSGDFNGDGMADIINCVNQYPDDKAVICINKGSNSSRVFMHRCEQTITLDDNLEWIYVADFNGDGLDDILISYRERPNYGRDIVTLAPYISKIDDQGELHFDPKEISMKFKIKKKYAETILVGDFLGEGKCSFYIQSFDPSKSDEDSSEEAFLFWYEDDCFKHTVNLASLNGEKFYAVDFDGDGRSEVWYSSEDGIQGKIVRISLSYFAGIFPCIEYQSVNDNFLTYYHKPFFGDFNGDGKMDILTYVPGDDGGVGTWQINLFKSNDLFWPQYTIPNGLMGINDPGDHSYSIFNRQNSTYNFMEVVDMNGDGKSDIVVRSYINGDPNDLFVYYAPLRQITTSSGTIEMRFADIQKFSGSVFFDPYGGTDNQTICVANLYGTETPSVIGRNRSFAVKPITNRYGVNNITDGMGNQASFEYDYLVHNPYPERSNIYDLNRIGENLGFDIYNKPLPIRAVKAIETTNINVANFPISRTEYQYSNAMVHKFGHGFLGFEGITQTSSVGRRNISQTVRTFTFKPMDEHCTLTPELDCVYRFKEGETNSVLVSKTEYQHAKFVCELDKLGKVFVPASIKTTTKNYELLGDRQMLRCRINEVRYNDKTGYGPFTYTHLVHPTESWLGTDATEQADVQRCEFLTHTRTDYMGIAEPWVINRPKQVYTKSTHTGFAESKSLTQYTYMPDRPYLTEAVTNYPSGSESSADKLATRTTFKYRPDGLLESETNSAFNDLELNGRERVTRYDYTPSLRFVSEEDKQDGFVTKYGYDEVWGELQWTDDCNGFRTFTENPDHLGLTTYTYDADNTENHNRINGTESATALRWIGCDGFKREYANDLADASYFSWTKGEASAEAFTIYDAAGRELRTVTRGLTEKHVIYKDTRYDEFGRVKCVSEPYFKGENAQWISYSYDDFDRVTRTDYPSFELDGNGTSTTYYPYTAITYQDLTTTTQTGASLTLGENDGESHTTRTTLNFMGWTDNNVEVLEDGENITSYQYNADGSLAWTKVNDQDFTKVSMGYDDAGNRTTLVDPDYGKTSSRYDAFGQLTYQETPKGDYTEYKYDRQGRQTLRTETTLNSGLAETTTWTFKEDQSQRGLLESIALDGRQTITYNYDNENYNRLETVVERIGNDTYTTAYTYGDESFPLRATSITYPTGFEVGKVYESSTGKLRAIKNGEQMLWYTNEANALGQITRFTYGNGVESINEYDERHFLKSQSAKKNDQIIQDFGYTYDIFANLAARTDNKHGMTESFEYDYLNRLETITLNGTESSMGYDEYGRIRSKQAQGHDVFSDATYDDWKKPHAIREATVETNPFDGRSQVIQYTMFDKVASIRVQDGQTLSYHYGYDHQRIKLTEIDREGPTLTCEKTYVGNCEFWNTCLYGAKSLTYLSGPMGVFAVVEKNAGGESLHYIYKDHLGSWTTITDGVGDIEQEVSFDAWGNIRSAADWTSPMSEKLLFDRGYTGHEHLYFYGRYYHPNAPHTDLSLINMNGRMYDPIMSSFLSVDNYVQSPENSQNFNRYAYCLNNPLKYTDPSGEMFGVDDIVAAAIAGAIINGFVQTATGNVQNFGDWCHASLIGASGGALGAGIGGVVAGSIGIGGFCGGAVAGAAGGAAGGFVSGAGNAWLGGASLGQGLGAGFYGAGVGALGGAAVGGLMRGISAANRGFNFWDGRGNPVYFLVKDMPEMYDGSDFDKNAWNQNPKSYNRKVRKQAAIGFAINKEPFDYTSIGVRRVSSTLEGSIYAINGETIDKLISVNGVGYYDTPEGWAYGFTLGSDFQPTEVYVSPKVIDGNMDFLNAVIGHEFNHAYHYFVGLPVSQTGDSENVALRFTHAYCNKHGISAPLYKSVILGDFDVDYCIPEKYRFSYLNY